jgi:hypothetical protein
MSDEMSLLKAKYCRAILMTATIATNPEARKLVSGLTTETATPNTTPKVTVSERAALEAIQALSHHLQGRSIALSSAEWAKAGRAIDMWVRSLE